MAAYNAEAKYCTGIYCNQSPNHEKIKQMVKFIEAEAEEKIEEIEIKAEEEFNLEKGRLVQQGRAKVQEHYEKKLKNIDLQMKIQQSNLKNQARLKILSKQHELMQECYTDQMKIAKDNVDNNQGNYKKTLTDLTVQALCTLLEDDVSVQVRPQDISLMKSILSDCEKRFSEETKGKFKAKLTVDEDDPLSPEIIGGVILSAKGGKIKCTNTINSRLDDVMYKQEPKLREMLFGANPNRKFRD